ncbi:hypothetical protein PTKIN_Ptkin03bG0000500 [Pterospermum kingtungense]
MTTKDNFSHLHCGCIAFKYLLELLDYEGVGCTSCAKSYRLHSIRRIQIHGDDSPKGFSALPISNAGSSVIEGRGSHVFRWGSRCWVSNAMHAYVRPPNILRTKNATPALDIRDTHDSFSQPSLSMSLGGPSGNPNFVLPFSSGLADGKEQSKMPSSFQQGQQSRQILPIPSKNGLATSSEMKKSVAPRARIARPPIEGRGKNHLLPRYWPKITDQELQKLSGEYP